MAYIKIIYTEMSILIFSNTGRKLKIYNAKIVTMIAAKIKKE
jgi:hypothetical protein